MRETDHGIHSPNRRIILKYIFKAEDKEA